MTEIFEALAGVSIFAVPCLVAAAVDQHKLERVLLREQQVALACERAVEADRLAWKNRVKQSLASWEPIQYAEDQAIRKARKWGRHA